MPIIYSILTPLRYPGTTLPGQYELPLLSVVSTNVLPRLFGMVGKQDSSLYAYS